MLNLILDLINGRWYSILKTYRKLYDAEKFDTIREYMNSAIKKYPNAFFSSLKYDERFPGGESPKEFFHRIRRDFFDIIKENKDVENLMIVTHAGVISIICHIIGKKRWSNKNKSLKIPKTSITKIVINKDSKNICYIGFKPHLDK